MKRRLIIKRWVASVIASLMVLSLTACSASDLKFWDKKNKDGNTVPDVEVEVNNVEYLTHEDSYDEGTELNVYDILYTNPEKVVEVIGFVDNSGVTSETYLLDTPSEMTIIPVYVKYTDGTEFIENMSVAVNEVAKIFIPENLYNWLTTTNVKTYKNFILRSDCDIDDSMIINESVNINVGSDSIMLVEGESYSAFTLSIFDFISGMIELAISTSEDQADIEEAKTMQFILDYFKSTFSEKTDTTPIATIYNVDGTTYNVYKQTQYITVDNIKHESSYSYLVNIDGKSYIFAKNVDSTTDDIDIEVIAKDKELKTEEDYKKAVDAYLNSSFNSDIASEYSIDSFDWLLVGDPNFYSTEEVAEDENAEVAEVITYVKQTYAEQHPELFNWPAQEIQYRKWIYTIESDTAFQGTVITPTGLITDSLQLGTDITAGSSTGSKVPTGHSTVGKNAEIKLEDGSLAKMDVATLGYTITQAKGSDVLSITEGGVQYNIAVVLPTVANNKVGNCYMSGVANPYIMQNNSAVHPLGRVYTYTITYTLGEGGAKTDAYMATIEISDKCVIEITMSAPGDMQVLNNIVSSISR